MHHKPLESPVTQITSPENGQLDGVVSIDWDITEEEEAGDMKGSNE